MNRAALLLKEKIISLSELQKNPSKALEGDIIRIVKNGKEIGIFMSKEEFEDIMEEYLPLNPAFEKDLKKSIAGTKRKNLTPLRDIL